MPTERVPAASVADALARLFGLHPQTIDLSLDRISVLLEALGNPHHRLPPVVHIAGTNGKGSVIAFMRAGLEAAGLRVHVYTSPHLVRFNERIRLSGRLIEDARLLDCLNRCLRANQGRPLTFFEGTTAAALLAFAEVPADFVLLETGLGGRLDATNVIARPALTAITTLALDHQEYLGNTLADIAREKAGIMKPGVPCVLAPQAEDLLPVLRDAALAVGAPLLEHGRDWAASDNSGIDWRDRQRRLQLPPPGLLGPHQIANAGLALTALNRLSDIQLDDAPMRAAATCADWPARMQPLHEGALRTLLSPDSELWLDGGHNASAADKLAETLAGLTPRPLHLVFGMLRTRDPRPFLEPFAGLAPHVWTVPIDGEAGAYTAEELAGIAGSAGVNAKPVTGVPQALSAIAATTQPTPRVLICGSLYLAGEVLRLNGTVPQ